MQFFSVEWLGDGQISVQRDDGTILQGSPTEILPPLVRQSRRNTGVALSRPRQDRVGGVSASHSA